MKDTDGAKPDTDGVPSFGEFRARLGGKVADRASVIAAMDCIMNHLIDCDDYMQWKMNAVPYVGDWNVLECGGGAAGRRLKAYMDIAKDMNDNEFECVCRTFASIIRGQCYSENYRPGAFDCGSDGQQGKDGCRE